MNTEKDAEKKLQGKTLLWVILHVLREKTNLELPCLKILGGHCVEGGSPVNLMRQDERPERLEKRNLCSNNFQHIDSYTGNSSFISS